MFYTSIDESYNIDEPNIVANEDYRSIDSFSQILYEAQQNDYTLFEGLIMADFHELAMVKSGKLSESDIRAFQENVISDAWDKIKEVLKKLWEKIKALFDHFLAFISGVFVRDGKKLVALWGDKIAGKDLSKLKVDWKECTTEPSNAISAVRAFFDKVVDGKNKFLNKNNQSDLGNVTKTFRAEFKKLTESEEEKNKIADMNLKEFIQATTDDIKKKCFGQTKQVPYTEVDTGVRECLIGGKKELKDTKDAFKDLNDLLKTIVEEVSSAEKESKQSDMKPIQKLSLTACKEIVTKLQTLVGKTSTVSVQIIKANMAQCRAAFLKAAHYNPKNESAFDDIDARVLYEDTMYEIDSDYDSFCYE